MISEDDDGSAVISIKPDEPMAGDEAVDDEEDFEEMGLLESYRNKIK